MTATFTSYTPCGSFTDCSTDVRAARWKIESGQRSDGGVDHRGVAQVAHHAGNGRIRERSQVDGEHIRALGAQRRNQRRTDEAGRAGDESDRHGVDR